MDRSKRRLLQQAVLLPAALAPLGTANAEQAAAAGINVILPKDGYRPFPSDYQWHLARAALDYLEDFYGDKSLPIWRRPFKEIELEKRLVNIAYWVLKGVQQHAGVWYVDPTWVMGQIMQESFFYEFAVSSSLALGVCQFILPTAKGYDLLCAGEAPAHHAAPYQSPELAGRAQDFYRLRSEKAEFKRANRGRLLNPDDLVARLAAGDTEGLQAAASQHLELLEAFKAYDEKIDQAREDFRTYLAANLEDRDIFDDQDAAFLKGFDQRLTYSRPISAMVRLLADNLRARNGNLLAAASGYNAGPSRTKDDGHYAAYGRIPALEETTKYVSHILVNHYEIGRRLP